MTQGKINVTSENIFPIIKKFLYSDHEIFLRELVSNAVDATQKLKVLASKGEFEGYLSDLTIRVKADKEAKTITVSDNGIGMTAEEIEKYINQIAFSGAEEFVEKYKDDANAIIGHFGLGFYSSFMVSKKVEIKTLSYKENAKAARWECDGSPEYTLEESDRTERGTDIVLHIDDDSQEFLEDYKINDLLKKYCKFLPIEIGFGKETEWKDGKSTETGKDKIINNTKPAWTVPPADLKDEDYKKFYKELYPNVYEEPLFHIHLNVDYPFNLTGILYFPKIRTNVEMSKNKIQLYQRQVFVTDSVEGIVPDFLTLMHGILDSPDIPLNVSRSYLQSDHNVKKISSHITKKVSDRLKEIFTNDREQLEKKWDDLKLFIEYGMLTDEKFEEKAEKFFLLKNLDGKYFTLEEYENLIKTSQTDKHGNTICLYTNDKEHQYSFIDAAKAKGYDVLVLDGQLDSHFINKLETKMSKLKFSRVDAEVIEKLIEKEDGFESKLSKDEETNLTPGFRSRLPEDGTFFVQFEPMSETSNPVVITQNEFMRRMKDMSQFGGETSFYGTLPDSYNMVINSNHPMIAKISSDVQTKLGSQLADIQKEIATLKADQDALDKLREGKKEEEISHEEKEKGNELEAKIGVAEDKRDGILTAYGKESKLVKQLIDLGLLSKNLLKGEALSAFVKRSVELIEA